MRAILLLTTCVVAAMGKSPCACASRSAQRVRNQKSMRVFVCQPTVRTHRPWLAVVEPKQFALNQRLVLALEFAVDAAVA